MFEPVRPWNKKRINFAVGVADVQNINHTSQPAKWQPVSVTSLVDISLIQPPGSCPQVRMGVVLVSRVLSSTKLVHHFLVLRTYQAHLHLSLENALYLQVSNFYLCGLHSISLSISLPRVCPYKCLCQNVISQSVLLQKSLSSKCRISRCHSTSQIYPKR